MIKEFIIGDLHLNDENIILFENRPFKSVLEMNNTIISNWNKEVSKEDKVLINGDFISVRTSEEDIANFISQLNGYKILILGNHDREISKDLKFWGKVGFNEVCNYPIIYKEWFMVSHEPMYVNLGMPYVNLFAHVHNNPIYKDYSERSFCTSAERIGYTPIEIKDVFNRIKSLC